MHCVQNTVAMSKGASVWLAGHSQGSAMALLAGKNMTKMGYFLETYLFNPPFFSVPIEAIKNEKVKLGIRITSSVFKAGLSLAVNAHDPFVVLSSWFPHLFVNPNDPICSEYIGYFKHRKKMEKFGVGKLERLATKNSTRSLISSVLGMNSANSEAPRLHLLPSAYLTINKDGQMSDFKKAHGLHQWWNPSFHCETMPYT
ncbi:GDSL esterase/lipase At4g10955-like isoform X2 [Fagus crenata]